AVLGTFRALSFGSLYPALRRLEERGLIENVDTTPALGSAAPPLAAKRARVVYALTPAGRTAFSDWVAQPGPEAWEDEGFAAHLAFFAKTEGKVRLRILEGRRSRLEERMQAMRDAIRLGRERMDTYTLQLQQHGLDGTEREVAWLTELIHLEQTGSTDTLPTAGQLVGTE
ncbi:MAG: PadR family transcriptional regulator, partial [Candidatus Nanopelagicales bacterium]